MSDTTRERLREAARKAHCGTCQLDRSHKLGWIDEVLQYTAIVQAARALLDAAPTAVLGESYVVIPVERWHAPREALRALLPTPENPTDGR